MSGPESGDLDLERVREEVAAWLEENWDPERPLLDWRGMLASSGWGCPIWPADYFGRDLPPPAAAVVAEEFRRAGAVGPATGSAMTLAAPTILAHGTDELKRRLLRPILTGEHRWCQLFSEPGNGSDLAGLTTRAVRDGDEWVVNGQKVWTTGAKKAVYGMLLARTDMDAPKHRGITYFALSMEQPGVEVRPLKQANGYASFNEVFLTDARVAHADVIGEVDRGWPVALTTLSHERGLAGRGGSGGRRPPSGRTAREAAEEAADYNQTYVWYPQRAGRPDLLVSQAQAAQSLASSPSGDAVTRQQVADVVAFERAARWNAQRAVAARAQGRPPGPEGSLGKLSGSEIARRSARAHGHIAGAHGMLAREDAPLDGTITEILVSVPAQSIAGGTDEIQHNIIGERVLGLPKEPAVDVDVPFRDVRTNSPTPRT